MTRKRSDPGTAPGGHGLSPVPDRRAGGAVLMIEIRGMVRSRAGAALRDGFASLGLCATHKGGRWKQTRIAPTSSAELHYAITDEQGTSRFADALAAFVRHGASARRQGRS